MSTSTNNFSVAQGQFPTQHALGAFARAQAAWAEHGVATFPVKEDKISAIKHYARVGLPASAVLARKFTDAPGLGFIAGKRSRITVLDVDTTDERVLADALARHGVSPLIMRTGSRKFHAYFRFNGELRRIRPWGTDLPIDIIGAPATGLASVVVAPPSVVTNGTYEIIQGDLDDLERLPVAKGLILDRLQRQRSEPKLKHGDTETGLVHEPRRNISLWEHCMRTAKSCGNLDTLIDAARGFNAKCVPVLTDEEVVKTAISAWGYEERDLNMFGGHGAVISAALCNDLIDGGDNGQDAMILLLFLRGNNLPWANFMVTNTLAQKFGWTEKRFAAARRRLIELGLLKQTKAAWRRSPALFEFPKQKKA